MPNHVLNEKRLIDFNKDLKLANILGISKKKEWMKWAIKVSEVLIVSVVPEVSKVLIAAPERCIKAFALTVVRNVRSHFGQEEIALSTVENAWLREDRQEQKTAVKENIPEKTVREHGHRLQKTLIFKFWPS